MITPPRERHVRPYAQRHIRSYADTGDAPAPLAADRGLQMLDGDVGRVVPADVRAGDGTPNQGLGCGVRDSGDEPHPAKPADEEKPSP